MSAAYDAYYNQAVDEMTRRGVSLGQARFLAHQKAHRRVNATRKIVRQEAKSA